MYSEHEKHFMIWWEENRLKEKRVFKQWLMGIPVGLLFAIPILINFFSGWFKRADMDLNSQISNHEFSPMVLIIAMLLIVSFIAIFSKKYKWEMNEQRYLELKARQQSGSPAEQTPVNNVE